MNQTLQLNLRQQLKLNPQLQQSIKLLQLSQTDLQQEIQYQLDNNPLLCVDEAIKAVDQNIQTPSAKENSQAVEASLTNNNDDWTQVSVSDPITHNSISTSDFNIENTASEPVTLTGKLEWQLELSHLSDLDLEIGYYVIENLNDKGFLTLSAEEIAQLLSHDLDIEVEPNDIFPLIHLIQQFEPFGCASRDLQEFLILQLKQNKAPFAQSACEIVSHHFDALSKHHYRDIAKHLRLNDSEIHQCVELIQSLKKQPNTECINDTADYIKPDIEVIQQGRQWHVQMFDQHFPTLAVNQQYATILRQSAKASDKQYLQENLQKARWFINGLQSRQQTIHKVAELIVEHQQDFFEHGEESLKPLRLQDIAEKLEMHESTISRATKNKYLQSSQGVFEMKYFFSNAIPNDRGGELSSTAIKSKIKTMIQAEPSRKPLSDNTIVDMLQQEGIQIARRTIAKYREALNIPCSSQRKLLNNF
ncbi:MAG: RNA polymerase factor sigma-54 [Kangiellaceae bacterium]|nr:RNA polymerase factor sigma-54 [Kangiellaceae bacterium]